ncbi:MAG: hypothetical protein H8D23_33065, partial [Candidatus Brocadiales bacterium]|nr:hypothetical protein [Candidatus Brocadiales bacterium]
YGLQKPLVCVPTLDVYANCISKKELTDENSSVVIPVIDARKKRFYCALYSGNVKISDSLDISAEDLFDIHILKSMNIYFSGPDAEILIRILRETRPEIHTMHFSVHPAESISEKLLNMGIQYFENNGPDSVTQGPIYIRNST